MNEPEVHSVTVLIPLDDAIEEAKQTADRQFKTIMADEPIDVNFDHDSNILSVTFCLAGKWS